MFIKKYNLLLSLLLIASASAMAADETADANGENSGNTIVVTATKTAQTIDESLAPVTVFTQADIQASQATTLAELLSTVPGMQVVQYGSQGSYTSMFLRGTNSNQTLVLIDGVRTNNTNGTSDIQYLDLNQIDRIEVVRGSRSSLYGADAIGGVIQIFTKKGSQTQAFEPSVKMGFGSNNGNEVSASVGGTVENTQYSATSSYESTNGFDNTGGTSTNPLDHDNDAFRNSSQSLNVTQNFTKDTSLNMIYNHNDGAVQYDDAFNTVQNTHNHFDIDKYSSAFKTAINNVWTSTLQAAEFTNNQVASDSFPSKFNQQHKDGNWQNDFSITDNQLVTAGVDYYEDDGEIANAFSSVQNKTLYNTAYFAQDQFSIMKNDFVAGLRNDDNSQYGSHTTGDFSWGRNITDTLRTTASYGKGFRAPTFTDLYYPGFSNPNLDPEKSDSYELGLKGTHATFNWEANVYQIDIKDLIQYDPSVFMPENLNKAQIQGLELVGKTHIGQWNLGSNVTFLNPRDEDTGYVLARRAKRTLNVDVDRSFGKFDIGASLLAQSQRFYDTANTQVLSGYGTVDLKSTYHVNHELDLQLKVGNVFDKHYLVGVDPVFGDNYQDGTNFFLTAIYTPK